MAKYLVSYTINAFDEPVYIIYTELMDGDAICLSHNGIPVTKFSVNEKVLTRWAKELKIKRYGCSPKIIAFSKLDEDY